jgi:hypothetical protein
MKPLGLGLLHSQGGSGQLLINGLINLISQNKWRNFFLFYFDQSVFGVCVCVVYTNYILNSSIIN